MAARPCPISLCECPGVDAPITNISAEAPDPLLFWGQIWNPYNPYKPPPLGNGLDVKVDCDVFNEIFSIYDPIVYAGTQLMANLQALAASLGCPWPTSGTETFTNDEQSATVYCADGSSFTYTVDAGTLTSPPMDAELGAAWVAWANAWAQAYAYSQASALLECIVPSPDGDGGGGEPLPPNPPGDDPPTPPSGAGILNIPLWCCADDEVNQSYIVSGARTIAYNITLTAGSIPPGTTLTQTGPRRVTITGFPTTPGDYNFTITGVSTTFPTMVVSTTIYFYVMGITNANSLPDGDVGTTYLDAGNPVVLLGAGGTAPYTFALDSGSTLPDGLALDPNGTISGTPTTDGDYTFDVIITDANGGECSKTVSITITGGLNPSLWWTMEVGGPIPPILDVIQSVPFDHFTGNTALYTKETGIVGQSWKLRATGAPADPVAIVRTPNTSFARFTDEGITIVWWQHRNGNNLPALGTPAIEYNFQVDAATHDLTVYQFGLSTKVNFDGPAIITEAALSLNTWHFSAVRIDNNANTITLDIDQTIHAVAAIAPIGTGVYADAWIELLVDCSGGGGIFLDSRYDEVAFFPSVLSDSDLDALWNGGAGRTWP